MTLEQTEVNVPLLRKLVEWVEEQDKLPQMTRQWLQTSWVAPESSRIAWSTGVQGCGTAYCAAGWVAAQEYPELAETATAIVDGVELFTADVAGELLGLEPIVCFCGCGDTNMSNHPLFNGSNTARDIRRIAESLAGERL